MPSFRSLAGPYRRANRGFRWPAVAVLSAAALAAGITAPASAGAGTGTGTGATAAPRAAVLPASSADAASLLHAYLKGRGLPAGSVTGIRPGSVHVAEIAGSAERWATASFLQARALAAPVAVRLQDGASAGIFASAPGQPWHLVQAAVEPLACDSVAPAAIRSAWNLAPQVSSCTAAASMTAVRAARARASLGRPGSIGASIASIALSQVGESDVPPVTSFSIDCDPYTTMVGPWYPDPDSRGCGYNSRFGVENENEEWCADFAEWVWLRAGITQDMDLINPGANSFYNWGVTQGLSLPIDGTDPQVGDAVVFYPAGPVTTASGADHVGIVTAVHPDGTIDIVNGDFLGNTNISVQYNQDVNIGPWSSQVWAPGEQWVFVPPPATSQPASPIARISGPRVAAAGTMVSFSARAVQPGGSVASYAWAFGDGEYEPNGAATGPDVQHVFADAGVQTVTMIATSSLGTITVRTLNVDVVSPSSAVASTPSDALYYAWTPVAQSLFLTGSTGGLAEDNWDGAGWLRQSLPGDVAAGSPVVSLLYKGSGDVYDPRVFARSTAGALIEVSDASGAWTARTLPAAPAGASPIVATTVAAAPPRSSSGTPSYPAVFSYDRAGQLTETAQRGSAWQTTVLPAPVAAGRGLAVATAFRGPVPVVQLYSVTRQGRLAVTSGGPGGWRSAVIPSATPAWPGTSLAAVSSGTDGSAPAVFFVDAAGHLARAWSANGGLNWSVRQLSTVAVEPGSTLLATNFVPSSGSPQAEVFAVSPSGQPLLTSQENGSWATAALPGTATGLLGLTGYAVPGSPQGVALRSADGVELDTAASGSGTWTLTGPLPATPATFADQVVLYGATKADLQVAAQAASSAGLPASAVTGSFATAWDHSLSGSYLVIAVGLPATDGLYFNVCGWSNPSDAFPGSTPFNLVSPPVDQLPGASNFEEAAGGTASRTGQLADDLAYYALHGQLPPGVGTLPAAANVQFTCTGQPSV
jgi:hypothetical protein